MKVQKYLTGLQWDGKPRIASFFANYATGANEFDATKWFVSAVARAMNPGCRVDTHLLLCGPQGSGKTKLLNTLFGEEMRCIRSSEDYGKCWIVEIDSDDIITKGLLTSTHDTFRPRYRTETVTVPRTCVFVVTVDNDLFPRMVHETRRFWPVDIAACASRAIEGDRDQLWAEAVHSFRAGQQWWD